MSERSPIVGITADVAEARPGALRAVAPLTYARAVLHAGGIPIVLPPLVELLPAQIAVCDAFVLTGGDDPRTEPFGEPTHPRATPIHPARQRYELALLAALDEHPGVPVLGVCLGMQLMALHRGGSLHQFLPDVIATAADHADDRVHAVRFLTGISVGEPATERRATQTVTSHHRQAVRDAGALRVAAVAPDGVIEAIDDPARGFFVGVQWHPERTSPDADHPLGLGLFRALIAAAGNR